MQNNLKRKLLFFDIDGTLLTEGKNKIFPESAKNAIRMAREKGHLAFINSGRVLVNIEDYILKEFDGCVCGCGTFIKVGNEILLHNKIEKEMCVEIAKACRKYKMSAVFEHATLTAYDKAMLSVGNRGILEYFQSLGKKMVDDITSEDFIFDKFAAWYSVTESDLDGFRNYIETDFTVIQREGDFVEVVPKGFSKATGIAFLQEYYHIDLEDVLVFGDSNNDLDMLRYVPHSIAMGVCTKEVEEVASYKTDTVLNDGIYKAMKHFGVIA